MLLSVILLQEERSKIYDAAKAGDVNAIQSLAENGVDVTGVVDPYRVSIRMCGVTYTIHCVV